MWYVLSLCILLLGGPAGGGGGAEVIYQCDILKEDKKTLELVVLA